jgi:hypothetical protein
VALLPGTRIGAYDGRHGNRDAAATLLGELTERAQRTYLPFALLINAAEAAGQHDLAMDYGRRSWEAREPGFILFARHHPEWAPLRSDPRFQALLREMDAPVQDGH